MQRSMAMDDKQPTFRREGDMTENQELNGRNDHTAEEIGSVNGEPGARRGLSWLTTSVFLVGEMAGSGLLALPRAMVNTGLLGIPLMVLACVAAGINGISLGKCWSILLERYPEEYSGHVRYPYPAMGEKAVGKWMRYLVSICIDVTLFGGSTVFLLIAAQNTQSMLATAHVHLSFCYLIMILAVCLVPLSWLGTPKDFWPIAIGASLATGVASILVFISMMLDHSTDSHSTSPPVQHSNPTFRTFFLAFGTILFAYGGASTFPTIQQDMRQTNEFPKSVLLGFAVVLSMYLPVAAGGYFVYGDDLANNVLQSLPKGGLRLTAEALFTCHLFLAYVIILNPFAQEFEEIFRIPNCFNWKRCVLRTLLVGCTVFVAESIPHFGSLLNLIGGSTVTFLTFVAPSLFYMLLCSKQGDWPDRSLPLHVKVMNVEIIIVGIIGGVASTITTIQEITSPNTFVPPCYINMTGAELG